jgi:hypothetical protein
VVSTRRSTSTVTKTRVRSANPHRSNQRPDMHRCGTAIRALCPSR